MKLLPAFQFLLMLNFVFVASAENLPAWISQSRLSSAPTLAIPSYSNINESLQQKGTAKIIVRLTPPSELTGGFKVEGQLQGLAEIKAQRAHIVRKQDKISSILSRRGTGKEKRFDFIPFMALEVSTTEFQALVSSEDIDFIQEDIPVPPTLFQSVPLVGGISGIFNGSAGSGQTVAILDTGVDKTHPFLAGKVVAEGCYSTTYAAQSSTPVCVSGSTAAGAGVQCSISGCEHGTHVAGIAAGSGTSSGTVFSGVAKDAKIIAVQIFSRVDDATACGGTAPCVLSYTSDQISALNYVYNLRGTYSISSVNMSLGGGSYTVNCDASNPTEKAAIDSLRAVGIATVIASGNSGSTNAVSAPACISSAISVGATDKSDNVASYSNSASILNLLAPGSAIFSSVPGGSFAYLSGTSMAAPHVTGAWAVLKSAKPSATVNEVLSALTTTGRSIVDSRNSILKPRIQLDAAVNTLKPPAASYTLSVSKLGSGGGTITSNSIFGISCGAACSSVIPVPQGNTVSFTAVPNPGSAFAGWSGGTCSGTANPCIVASASGNMTVQAIFLTGTTVTSEPFSGSAVPNGWTALDNLGGTGRNWAFVSPCFTNLAGGSGNFAIAEANCKTSIQNVDSSLVSPGYDLSQYSGVALSFKTNIKYYSNSTGDVDISNDGGVNWTNIWRKGPGAGGTSYGPVTESIDINSLAAGRNNVKVRFRYYTNNSWGYYWEVDDFTLSGVVISSPTAITGSASELTGSSATLNGSINDNNAATTGSFLYGTTSGYGSGVSAGTVSAGSGTVPLKAAISGLNCNTTYHFRLVGSNTVGTANGFDQTFMTTACAPDAPTITSAKAGDTQASIYFSPTSNGGSPIISYTVTPNSGLPVTSDAIPIVISGLANGSPYTFTVRATNAAGAGEASPNSTEVTPGVVRNSGGSYEMTGYQTLQNDYEADTDSAEIQIVAGTHVGSFVKDDSDTVTIKGGFDAAFSASNGLPAVLGVITLKKGKTIFQNVVIKP